MAGSRVISMNPCRGWTVRPSRGLPRVVRMNVRLDADASHAPVCGLISLLFPSRDAGLRASLLQVLLRLVSAVVAAVMAARCMVGGNMWGAMMLIAGGVLVAAGLLVRLTGLAVGVGLCVVSGDMEQSQILLSVLALGSGFLLFLFGGGWFGADYFIGRYMLRRRRERMSRLDYKALSHASETMA